MDDGSAGGYAPPSIVTDGADGEFIAHAWEDIGRLLDALAEKPGKESG